MAEPPAGTTKDPLPSLDGLRGIAVLLVLLQHVPIAGLPSWYGRVRLYLQPGYLGVDIFFVLSGFLITRILLVDQARGWPLKNFLMRRCLRIFPIFYLTVGVLAFVRPGPELPWVATYLANFWFVEHRGFSPLTHTWSLCVEEHFYMFWPAIIYVAGPQWAKRVALLLLIPAAIGIGIWITATHPLVEARNTLQIVTQVRVLSLAAGAVLAWHEGWLRTRCRTAAALALLVGGLGWFAAYSGMAQPALRDWFPVWWLVGFAGLSTGIVVLAVALDGSRNPISSLLTTPPLRRIGRISYGLYLYHPIVFWAFGLHGSGRDHEPGAWMIALALLTSFVVAEISFALIERPILKLQARFRPA